MRPAGLLLCLGCLAASPTPATPSPDKVVSVSAKPAIGSALDLWEQGQRAMLDGDVDAAIAAYQASQRSDPTLTRNLLSLAAAYLEKGDDPRAVEQMGRYLLVEPNHYVVRAHLAELLLRLERSYEARQQFERFVADIQSRHDLAEEHLVHCHSRLMEIAESQEDEYSEHLHRGIGLLLLARQRAALANAATDSDLAPEALLCKAAAELTLARQHRPEEARPCWYLFVAWSQLARHQPAARWLRAASAAAPFSYLTPDERQNLALAESSQRLDMRRH